MQILFSMATSGATLTLTAAPDSDLAMLLLTTAFKETAMTSLG